jgi:predicted ester cyclase
MHTMEQLDANIAMCVRSVMIMADGTLPDFEAVVHPAAVNREAKDEPPASRGLGPRAFHATALWLREAFADLRFEVHEAIARDDLVAMHLTMSGRHTGDMINFDADANVVQVFPPTGKDFAATHSHWFRIAEGKVAEHWANRDDLGTALQLGWVPPSPAYLLRSVLAKRRAIARFRRHPDTYLEA